MGDDSKRVKVPLVMGIICLAVWAVYLWSAFHGRSAIMALIVFVPILSIVGLVFSFITRSERYYQNKIWLMGLISCLLSLALFGFIYLGTMFALAQR